MGEFVRVAGTSDLAEGSVKKVRAGNAEILLARLADGYYALANRCPHLGGDLSAGTLDGDVVTCPRHGSRFDVRDGSVLRWMKGTGLVATIGKVLKPPRPVRIYNVKVVGEDISIEV